MPRLANPRLERLASPRPCEQPHPSRPAPQPCGRAADGVLVHDEEGRAKPRRVVTWASFCAVCVDVMYVSLASAEATRMAKAHLN